LLNFVRPNVIQISRLNPSDENDDPSPVADYNVLKSEVLTRALNYFYDVKCHHEIRLKSTSDLYL